MSKSFVGKEVTGAHLEGGFGTKHAVVGSVGGFETVSLDHILEPVHEPILLLKSDVDGFDYDVLNSALARIEKDCPMLYFEAAFDFDYQLVRYLEILRTLQQIGYGQWVIFDNFGLKILETSDIDVISQLFEYVSKMNHKESTRTIYYFDVLGFTKKHEKSLRAVLDSY